MTMKMKLLIALAGLALVASPALAASTTVEFAGSNGQKVVVVFNSDGTAVANGGPPVPYTVDQAAKKICSVYEAQTVCVTFAEMGAAPGFKTTYTDNNGGAGTATITAVTE
jgi:hypothetical protein